MYFFGRTLNNISNDIHNDIFTRSYKFYFLFISFQSHLYFKLFQQDKHHITSHWFDSKLLDCNFIYPNFCYSLLFTSEFQLIRINIIIFLEKIFKISGHTNTIFELTSVQPLKRQIKNTPIDRSNKLKVDQKSLQNNNNDFDDNDINKQNGKQMQVNEKII